jgi:hypothetical protein
MAQLNYSPPPPEVQSWIRPDVLPPTTQSTRLGWLAVTAGTAVTLVMSATPINLLS